MLLLQDGRAVEGLSCGGAGMAVSFLARQKGRLAASKQRRVAHVCDQAVEGTLARLAAAGLDAAALPCAPISKTINPFENSICNPLMFSKWMTCRWGTPIT